MIKSVVIKSSDFMKESENVSDEGIAAIVKIRKDIFFSPPHLSACRSAV